VGMALRVQKDIIGLDVPMDYTLAVQVLKCRRELSDPETDNTLWHGPFSVEVD
jgi:hypothetical protein